MFIPIGILDLYIEVLREVRRDVSYKTTHGLGRNQG